MDIYGNAKVHRSINYTYGNTLRTPPLFSSSLISLYVPQVKTYMFHLRFNRDSPTNVYVDLMGEPLKKLIKKSSA